MATKVKGLLKGLRYISQIFEEKEEEIQIGFPTDVKHVAHIGSDDPSANAPSWMTEYKSGNDPSSGTTNDDEKTPEEDKNSGSKGSKIRHLIPKSRHHSIDNDPNSNKHKTRRHRTSDPTADASNNDSSGGSRQRRHRRGSNQGSESPAQDLPPTGSKHSNRRKSKEGGSEDGSSRKTSSRTSRRSKGDSLTDISFSQELGSGSGPESVPEPIRV